jgi:GNAT superfamily N-acetyltransferase
MKRPYLFRRKAVNTKQLPIPRDLGDGLTLRVVQTEADADKVVAINGEVHDQEVRDIVRHWFDKGHPTSLREYWFYVDDLARDQAAATLCLIPMTWHYGGYPLPVAELGFVATRPAYRGRGLQRVLSEAFRQLALELGHTLAGIEGIPGFYGQFGYEYALPLNDNYDLEFGQVPDEPVPGGYSARRATLDDVPALQRLYDADAYALDIAGLRDVALWEHQLSAPPEITFYATTTVIKRQQRVVGYVRWGGDEWSDRLLVSELAVDDDPDARERILTALRFVRQKGLACQHGLTRKKAGLRLRMPASSPAVNLALEFGAVSRGHYGWQMQVLDPVGFMRAIGPALEERLARSPLAGYGGSLVFDLYRSRLALRFEAGKLAEVSTPLDDVQAHAGLRLKTATQLWLGWRGREALEAWYPDFWSQEAARPLLDVLFPQTRAYVYMVY